MKRYLGLAVLLAFGQLAGAQEIRSGVPAGMVDRYLTKIASRLWQKRAAEVAALSTPEQVRRRQQYIRRTILQEIGGFPDKTPLNARITGTLERDGYRVEKLIYESEPRHYVTANVYVPAKGQPPYPAVLGTSGHSDNGKANALYQRAWIAFAKRGFIVLAFDPPGQGERYEYFDVERNKPVIGGTNEHTMAGVQCLLTGTNYARYELWDGIRGVDYLLTRKDVDRERLAVAGNSGGGTQTAYMQVVEPRFAVAAPSCYLTSWEKLWSGPGPQDAEQDFAGFLRDGLDFGDFLIAFAPKPVKMMTAIRDFFPIDGARATFAEARRVYEVLGAGDRIGFFEYDDPHGWSKPRREATYQWFDKWLYRRDGGAEPDFPTEPDANLNCTATGQIATSLKGETVQSLNQAHAERIFAARTFVKMKDPAQRRSLIAEQIGEAGRIGQSGRFKIMQRVAAAERQDYRVSDVGIETEEGITVPALLFIPAAGPASKPAVLYLNPDGKKAESAPGGEIEALAKAGNVVLAPDLRNWGESAPPKRQSGGYTAGFQAAMRALLVGRTMIGIETYDALRCFDYLARRDDVDAKRVSVLGKGNGGVVALYAAALEPKIRKVAVDGAVLSYMDIVRAKMHRNAVDVIVPGVLKHFDLPDLAALILSSGRARTLWIVDARSAAGEPVPAGDVRKAYAAAARLDGFRALGREGTFGELYAEWMRR